MKTNNGSRKSRRNAHRKPQKTDRISDLPDVLLITILSFLPIDTAVTTSVLSRRWRNIWKYITSITLPPNLPKFLDFKYLVPTVDHIIPQILSLKIEKFDLVFFRFPNEEDDDEWNPAEYTNILIPWFQLICVRIPGIIKVDFRHISLNPWICFNLSTYLFNTPSLVYLKLYLDFQFDGNVLSIINLPNLKKLRIILGDRNRDLLGLLFKSCPLLEDLKLILKLVEADHFVDISAPNLKRLMISLEDDDQQVNVNPTCRISMNTPNLEYFIVNGFLSNFEFVSRLTNLLNVIIGINEDFDGANFLDFQSKLTRLFHGISRTRSLNFQACGSCISILEENTNVISYWPPIFGNLRHLSFGNKYEEETFPTCLLSKLKMVEIYEIMFDEIEMKMFEYILSKSPVLEKMKLYLHPSSLFEASDDTGRLVEEYSNCARVFILPRLSVNCVIEYHGRLAGTIRSGLIVRINNV